MRKIIAFILALALVFSLCGCGNTTPSPTTEPVITDTTAPAVTSAYTQAAASLRDAQNLRVELTTEKKITTLGGTFASVSEQTLTLAGVGTDTFSASMTENLEIENHYKFTEYFADDTLFVNIHDVGYFKGDMSATDFLSRFAPAVLLDETLYADVSSRESDVGVTLKFSNPTSPEAWALPQGAKFLDASGMAVINDKGTLEKTVYTINYTQGNITVSMEVTAEARLYNNAAPKAPKDLDRFIKIDSIDGPRLYSTAFLYLYSSKTTSSTYNETVIWQAANYAQSSQIELHYTGSGKNFLANMQSSFSSVDDAGATSTSTLTEEFRDGKYSYCENNGEFLSSPDVSATAMLDYLQGYYSSPGFEFISSAKLEDVNGLICLEMKLNAEWGKLAGQSLSYLLYDDEGFLDSHSTAYNTIASNYYLFLDPASGFPISSGTSYTGLYTIDGNKYALAQDVTQRYKLADSSTYTELTGEIPAETAPVEQATPLLYRVTGSDGQEMYLMGTIHVGDEKTGFLPDEVYAAFDACDALAVEFDILDFEKKIEADPQLAAKFAELYVNPNGDTTKSLLDTELYEKAVKLLKANGDYSSTMEYIKPYFWNSSIEGLYLTLSSLRSEKGMDMRLLRRAKEQDKKILDVESALFQHEMSANFSNDLQELLLGETVACSVTEYCEQLLSLYELWCDGDEAALRQMLKDDVSDLSDEEMALYKEYTDAMIIDRNIGMLNVAISYLESDEAVFYAVGLAHLLQENGLVDTLRDAGYTVEQVSYNQNNVVIQ